MKKTMIRVFSCMLVLVLLLTGCTKQTGSDDILFGESKETVFAYFGVTAEDVVETGTDTEDPEAVGFHTDIYSFADVPFADIKTKGINISEMYWIDETGKRYDLGVTNIQWVFPGEDYENGDAFWETVEAVLKKDKHYGNLLGDPCFYDSSVLTDAQWTELAENSFYEKSEYGTGYRDTKAKEEKPMIRVSMSDLFSDIRYELNFSGFVFSYVKHPESAKVIKDWIETRDAQ